MKVESPLSLTDEQIVVESFTKGSGRATVKAGPGDVGPGDVDGEPDNDSGGGDSRSQIGVDKPAI